MNVKTLASVIVISFLVISIAFTHTALQLRLSMAASTPVFQDGFESGSLSSWSAGGSAAVVQSPVHSGSYAARASGSNSYWHKNLGSSYSELFFASYIQLQSTLSSGQTTLFLYILDATYTYKVAGGLQVDNSGNARWVLRVNNNWYPASSAVSVQSGAWYFMEIKYSTSGTAGLWVNGGLVVSATGQTLSGGAQMVQGGNPYGYTPSGFVSYSDDCIVGLSYMEPGASPSSTPSSTPTPTTGNWLYTSGTNIYDSQNRLIVWNGFTTKGLFGYENSGGGPLSESYTPNDISVIKNRGFNYVRLDIAFNSAVYGVSYTSQTPTKLNYNPRFWTLLDSLVDQAQTDGIWINLNFGCTDGTLSPIGGYWGIGNGFPKWMYDGSWSYFNKIYANDGIGLSDAIRDFWNIDDPTAANVRIAYQTFWKDIAYRYRDTPNVVFSLFNEPQCEWGRATVALWDGLNGHPDQSRGAQMYQSFMESTIDIIRSQEVGNHIVIVNEAFLWDWFSNLQIRRSNVVVQAHTYQYVGTSFFNLGWRFNQPFILGEFGGIEDGFSSRDTTISQIQTCNQNKVSWAYLRYNPGYTPSTQTWADLQSNRYPNLLYCQ